MLVGRAPQVQVLTRLVAEARLGTASALVVLGDPGAGKTALLGHVVEGLAGDCRVLCATGIETEQEIAFAGLSQLLAPALDLVSAIPGPQAEAIRTALALHKGRPGDRFTIGAATLSLLSAYAEHGPVVVVVDDAHLLDLPTLEALAFAARRVHTDQMLLLFAARRHELGSVLDGLPVLELSGLAAEDARYLVESVSRGMVTDEQFLAVFDHTAGNPLALRELGTDLGAFDPGLPGLPATVPSAVTRAFDRRLGSVDEGTRRVLLAAVVAGGDLPLVAAACLDLELDLTLLASAEDEELVTTQNGRVSFRHPLLRASIYSGATADQRHRTHRAVAGALPPDDVDRRAWHLAAAAWGPDAGVADLLVAAGEGAFARSGYSVAASALHRAASLSPDSRLRCARLLRAAEAAWAAGQQERVRALLDELSGLAPTAEITEGASELLAAVEARTGSLRTALQMLQAAAEKATSVDRVAVLLADAALVAFQLGDSAVMLELAQTLEELTPRTVTDRARALALMASGISRVLTGSGGADAIRDAVPLLESSLELRSDPRRLPWLMLAPLFLRESTGGGRLRTIMEELRGASGVGALPAVLFHIARDQATTTSWDQAAAGFDEAVRLARETGQHTELAASLAGRCCLEARQGEELRCRGDAEEALAICRGRGIHLFEAWVLMALGDLELSIGDAAAAIEWLSTLERLLVEQGMADPDLSPDPELVDALVRTGDSASAATLAARHLVAADAKGQPWARARARRALGLVAPPEDIDAAFGDALDLHAQTLDLFETARTRLAYGERMRRAGRRVEAREQLRLALECFERLGASQWAHRAAAELSATGETVERVEVGWRTALTPQELQVALLLAEGRTTREAAAALFLSPKTVEYHLRKVYTKLAIHSREELAVALGDAVTHPQAVEPGRPESSRTVIS